MSSLQTDPNLDRAREVEGYKVLPPCVVYARIGQGGMGAVYRGRHLNLDIDVAVKCLKPELVGSDEQFVVRFRREARAAAQINHQNVIRVFDVAEDNGLHYIVMELVAGETARQRVQRKQRLAVGEALEILCGAANGLAEAHRKGFVHRDIKPDNILISSSGQVKVADLGLAKPSYPGGEASLLSGTNVVMGTPQYMPPEQWENTAAVTPAADVWALGATLFFLLAGGEAIARDSLPRIMQRIVVEPFPDIRAQRPDVPADVAALIAKATARDPQQRYRDAGELVDALQALATRREALSDRDASPTTGQFTLLSPPPPKTLAKIKLWMDQQGATVTGGTGSRPVETAVPAATGRSPRRIAAATVAAIALLGGAALLWQPWRSEGWFELAARHEAAGNYELALAEVLRVYAAHPELPGRSERLGRLHAAWGAQLAAGRQFRAALGQFAASLTAVDSAAVRAQQRELLAAVGVAIEAALERVAPAGTPVPAGATLTFRGRIEHELLRELRIAGRSVARAVDGSFELAVDPGGQAEVAVSCVLVTGEILDLWPWRLTYERQLSPVALAVSPEELVVDDDDYVALTIRVPAGAELLIDGAPVARSDRETTYVHRMRSAAEVPEPVVVIARAAGFAEARRTVPVTRRARELTFVGKPAPVGVRQLADLGFATGAREVRLAGQLSEPATELLVDGKPAIDLQWRERGQFTCTAVLPQVGENTLRIEAQRRFRAPAVTLLPIARLEPPVLAVAGDTADGAQIAAATCKLAIAADQWTTKVVARNGRQTAALARAGDTPVFCGEIRLEPGGNRLEVVAVNAIGQEATLVMQVERLAESVRPKLVALEIVSGDRRESIVSGSQVFVRGAALLRITSSDPGASVLLNGSPVAVGADGAFPLHELLIDGQPVAIEVAVENGAGRSPELKFFPTLDTTPPAVEVDAPRGVVVGRPLELRGRWRDDGGLQRLAVDGVEGRITPGRGAARKGEWSVRLPARDTWGELSLVAVDRAGNEQVVPVRLGQDD